jgi:hypothetical protein
MASALVSAFLTKFVGLWAALLLALLVFTLALPALTRRKAEPISS